MLCLLCFYDSVTVSAQLINCLSFCIYYHLITISYLQQINFHYSLTHAKTKGAFVAPWWRQTLSESLPATSGISKYETTIKDCVFLKKKKKQRKRKKNTHTRYTGIWCDIKAFGAGFFFLYWESFRQLLLSV